MNTNVESVLKVIASVVLLHRKQNENEFYVGRALPSNNLCSQHRQINEHADQSGKKNRDPSAWLLLCSSQTPCICSVTQRQLLRLIEWDLCSFSVSHQSTNKVNANAGEILTTLLCRARLHQAFRPFKSIPYTESWLQCWQTLGQYKASVLSSLSSSSTGPPIDILSPDQTVSVLIWYRAMSQNENILKTWLVLYRKLWTAAEIRRNPNTTNCF